LLISRRLLPAVKNNFETPIAAIGFLNRLSGFETWDTAAKYNLLNEVISEAIEKLALEPRKVSNTTRNTTADRPQAALHQISSSELPLFQNKVAVIASRCYKARLLPHFDRIITILGTHASKLAPTKLETICLLS
jgi:hypothetical protein